MASHVDCRDDRLVEFELTRHGTAADHGVVDFALFEDVAARPLRHCLDVATDAKEVARAGQHHDIDRVIVC